MASKKNLNIFWGEGAFHIVETEKGEAVKFFTAAFDSAPLDAKTPEGIRYTTVIQKAIQENTVIVKNVNLCLPTKDIIFRSFVIPFMHSNEIRGAVAFEAGKYTPFKMEEICYTYYSVPFSDNKIQRIRILFVAIRRDLLERYCSILEHSALNVAAVEPAAMSLVRLCLHKKIFSRGNTTALIEVEAAEGRIMVVEGGVVQFVREFQTFLTPDSSEVQQDIMHARLFNEIKISLDYYARQQKHEKVTKAVLLTEGGYNVTELSKQLQHDYGVSVTTVNPQTFFKNPKTELDLGLLNAYGLGLKDHIQENANFELSLKTAHPQNKELTPLERIKEYTSTFITIGVCIGILILNVIAGNFLQTTSKNRIKDLTAQLSSNVDLTIKDIKAKTSDISNKFVALKEIRTESKVFTHLTMITQLLPEGVWFQELRIQYLDIPLDPNKIPVDPDASPKAIRYPRYDSKLNLTINGYVYLEDKNQQIRLVNNMVTKLKDNKNFAGKFENINLLNVRSVTLNNYPVTQFDVSCQ